MSKYYTKQEHSIRITSNDGYSYTIQTDNIMGCLGLVYKEDNKPSEARTFWAEPELARLIANAILKVADMVTYEGDERGTMAQNLDSVRGLLKDGFIGVQSYDSRQLPSKGNTKYIQAIKEYRRITNSTLLHAKDSVDEMIANMEIPC